MTDRYYINPAPKRKKGTMNKQLVRIQPNGTLTMIDNKYQAISEGVGASFDFVYAHAAIGFYIDDEGLLNGSRFNCVASMMAGRALYGNAVLTNGDTDNEGETLPPSDEVLHFARSLSSLWTAVVYNATMTGQDVMPPSNEATVPAPTITSYDDAESFFQAMGIERD